MFHKHNLVNKTILPPFGCALLSRFASRQNCVLVNRARGLVDSVLNDWMSILEYQSMEEAEVPLENVQERIHHSAEHSSERWISWVALSTAILAVLAAIAGLLSGKHSNEAMMSQIEASDQWSYYQAKSIKASVLDAKITLAIVTKKSRKRSKPKRSRSNRRRNRIFISTKFSRVVSRCFKSRLRLPLFRR